IIQIDPDPTTENNVIAADDAGSVVPGRAITVNVLANDTDPEGDAILPGSVRIVSGPDRGTATVNPDGTITYQSVGTEGYFVTFVYEIFDAKGAADTATVTIEVLPAANNVIAVDDTGEIVPAGASKAFNVTGNDVDPQGDAFSITGIVTGPTRGTASFNAATGNIIYNSVASNTGYTEVITYEITDARGAKDTATLTIRVEPTNNVSAVDDTADLKAGQDVRINVLRNDFDAQGDNFSITRIVDQPRVRDGSGFGDARGTVTINPDGTITFTDTAGARDSAVVEFSYEIRDAKGATDIAVVRVTITPAANGVDANNDTLTLEENSGRANVTPTLLRNDFDPQGDTFKITKITQPAVGGTVELVGDQVFFTPTADYFGPVTFTYTITDSKGATDTAQVVINVTPEANTDLNAGNDFFNTAFNTNLTITPAQVLANDNDPEGSVLNSASIISFTQPANGSVTRDASGNFIYNPNNTFRGTDTFTYTIRDAQGDVATATISIRVADPLPQDNPVDARDDLVILAPGETRSVNALTNDSAPDGGLAFVRLVDPLPAGVTNLGNGVFRYTAPDNTTGQTISFRYEVRDADGDTDIATVTFKVEGPVNSVIAN
ncbi:MAG: tandem-95 repeat protein, partial [Alphaproteobacteria bacterium]